MTDLHNRNFAVDTLSAIFRKKGSTIRFNNLLHRIINEVPEKELNTMKRSLGVLTSMKISLNNVTSVADFIDFLLDKEIIKERNVIMMQYLLRRIKRPDLEMECVEYATENKQALCYYEEMKIPGDGRKQIKLHVVNDIENFYDIDLLRATVAAIVGYDPVSIEVVGIHPESSFIITMLVKAEFARLLLQKDQQQLTGLLKFNVDWIQIEDKVIKIKKRSMELDFANQKSYALHISHLLENLFRRILRRYVPESDFMAKIQECKGKLLPLLDDAQQSLLYPKKESFSVSFKDLDLHLLYILLKSVCGIAAHEQGWGNFPNPTDTSLAANIERIIDIHVTYCGDAPRVNLKLSDFDQVMKKVIQISGRIDGNLYGSTEDVSTYDQDTTTIHDKENKDLTDKLTQLRKQEVLGALRNVSLSQKVVFSASQISSIIVPGVRNVYHISVVTSDRLWVSDHKGRLLQVDYSGRVLHDKLRVGYFPKKGNHTVTEDGDLLFIYDDEVRKLTSDGTVITLLTTDGEALCIHSSRINGDILVGSDEKVTRYDRTGRKLQVIETDDKGLRLYRSPIYITENKNGDIWISDEYKGAVVVVDKSGHHRFDYAGRQSDYTDRQSEDLSYMFPFTYIGFQSHFYPRGICTDVLGHVLVCDFDSNSVHLLDHDGEFLSLLLTREQHGIRDPMGLCVDDQHNLYLGQCDSNTINVYKYLQDTDVK